MHILHEYWKLKSDMLVSVIKSHHIHGQKQKPQYLLEQLPISHPRDHDHQPQTPRHQSVDPAATGYINLISNHVIS